MEIGHETLSCHTYGVNINIQFIVINNIGLGEHMDYLLSRLEHNAVLVVNKMVNIRLLNQCVVFRNHDTALIGATLDVLSGYSHIDLGDIHLGHVGCITHSLPDRTGSASDIAHHTVLNTH